MAGIFANIDSDISKIRKLKAEIESVKKSLQSIDVKVNIDISQGLEARLKSLTGQYDALMQKAAQAEAKIAESTARINKSAETVIKAQEQMARAAGAQPQAAAGGTSSTANQAQAKAYEELAQEIDEVIGTRAQNIRRIVEEQNAIKMLNAQISNVRKNHTNSNGIVNEKGVRLLEHYNSELEQHKIQLAQARQQLSNNIKLDVSASTSINALSQSLGRMRMAYRELTEEERKSPFGQELLASIQQADAKIKQLDATIGNHQRNVGNYASGWNGLNMSIQQIGRELPSLAMGINTFFLAISNNLPILTDEIARARKEYNTLKAAGQQATPVWKQVVSSLVSWQTALTVGITLLTLYGKNIIEWVGNLFKAKDGTAELEAATKRLNTTVSKVYGSISEEMRNLRSLNDALQNAKRGTDEWESIRQKIVSGYSKYLPSIDSEIEKTGTLAGSYDKLAESIQRAAAARGFEKYSAKENEKYVEERNKQLQRVYDAFIGQLGEDEGLKKYQEWLKLLDSGMRPSLQKQGEFGKINKGLGRRNANYYLIELQNLQEAHDKALERYREIFNMSEGAETVLPVDSIKAMRESIAARREALEQMSVGSEEYAKLKAQIEADEKKLEKLTQKQDKTNKEADKRKESRQKLSDELLELRRRNQQAETDLMEEGTEKKLKRIDDDYEAQKAAIEKKAQELAELNEKAGASGTDGGGLTSEQRAAIDEARRLNEEDRAKAVGEVYEAEAEAMREYLRQYGTFQQQKLAIAEEYAEKIRRAQTEGERLSLEKERDAAVNKVEMEAVRQQVDWGSVFGNFGVMFKEQIRPTIERLEEIARSDEFQSSGLEEKEILYSLISGLRQSETLWDGDIFREISEDLVAYRNAMNAYMEAQQRETAATRRLAEAKERLKAAEESGDSEERDAAQLAVDEASANLGKASKDVQRFGSQVQQTTSGLQEAAERAANMFGGLESGLQGLSSGSLKGIGQGVMQLDKLFSGGKLTEKLGTSLAGGFQKLFGSSKVTEALTKGLGNAGLAGSIVSAVLGMLDTIAENGLSGIVSGLMDTVFGAVNSILKDALSFNMVEKVGGSLIDGLKGTLDTITFGGFSSWLNLGGNDKEVQETIDRLTESNEYLRQSIDGLAERINQSDTTNEQSVDYYNRARQSQLDWEETQREIIKEAASAWTNSGYGFLGMGGKGSFNAHAPGSGWEGWDAFTETLRKNGFNITVSGTEQLWELTPEQMKLLRDSNPSEWQQLFSGDGHRNPKEYVDEYIEAAGTLEELTDSLNEKLTGYNWSGFLDQYKSLLKNMESSTEDFADFINDTISNALIEAFVNEQLQDDIKELYQYMADHAADGLSDTEIDAIRRMNEEIADKSIEWRQRMAEAGLIGESSSARQQTATSKGFETMTQDQASELSGRFTAVAESNYRIEGKITELSGSISTMMVSVAGMYNIADETRTILANSYLELREINENTGNSAKYLKDIKADIAIVKQNTSRI